MNAERTEENCGYGPPPDPHSIALWCLLRAEGFVRHRQHLEALAVIVGREGR